MKLCHEKYLELYRAIINSVVQFEDERKWIEAIPQKIDQWKKQVLTS